jgi:hypothetical protein
MQESHAFLTDFAAAPAGPATTATGSIGSASSLGVGC